MSTSPSTPPTNPQKSKKYRKAVTPGLRRLLYVVFGLFALLGANSLYLSTITALESATGETYENYFYQYMFLGHLILGLAIVLPVIVFGALHIRNTHNRPNRRAVRAGYALFVAAILLLVSGFVLMRLENLIEVRDPTIRSISYWVHVITPFLVIWLFILHRLAGRKIKWKVGASWLAVAGGFALVMALLQSQDPRKWNVVGPASGEQYFFPSLARTATGNFIPAKTLMMDDYCLQCHADIHAEWSHSAHRFSSFNNPAYLFSVRGTRTAMIERDGNVQGSRFCAGCHDPVPFFSGAFDDPNFDDVNHPTAQAGITCTTCHAITNVNSPRGNSDYTIEEPTHYPFAFSDNPVLKWINRQLVKSKPAFHKKTFLKPLHKTPEFCGTCHKVHLPEELNDYKWLRGQNHYDAYHLSGVSGHGVQSFYYPPKATHNCNACHMQLVASEDFAAKYNDDTGKRTTHDHLFPSANTAIPYLKDMPPEVIAKHEAFNKGVMRVDIFGLRKGGTIEGELLAPLGPELPEVVPGESYLLETVIRTLKMGHLFTQGTADSNEVWLDVKVTSGGQTIGRSGGMDETGEVDPWSHFANAYVLDRHGNRIDRRNAEDIFIPLYNNQIPPGAGDVVHYLLDVPQSVSEPVTIEVALRYRKFDTKYMRYFQGDEFDGNDLPIMTLATDKITLPVAGGPEVEAEKPEEFPLWQRWNDYGIGLLRKARGGSAAGELRQAEEAFLHVESLKMPDGPINLARVYYNEGRLDDAVAALERAAKHQPPANVWTVAWFTGLVNKDNGFLDEAIANFKSIVTLDTEETRSRGFDFSEDYNLLAELGQTIYERAKEERGEARAARRKEMLEEARGWFERVLTFDPEHMGAHYNLALILEELGDMEGSASHRAQHEKYKPDDNATDRAIAKARIDNAAADHAAQSVVIYDLRRQGAYEGPIPSR